MATIFLSKVIYSPTHDSGYTPDIIFLEQWECDLVGYPGNSTDDPPKTRTMTWNKNMADALDCIIAASPKPSLLAFYMIHGGVKGLKKVKIFREALEENKGQI